MDEMLKELERFKDFTSAFTLTDVVIVLVLSCILSMVGAWIYRYTHRGTSYAQSFAQTLVVMGMVTAFIMLIIGSNIARAFSLVGALSVIRFRNAVKETRDVAFMFMVMAIGMACGTRFYMLAVFATVVLSAVHICMYKLDMFSKRLVERILRIRLPQDVDAEVALEPVFRKWLDESRIIAMESVQGGMLQELVYSVVLRRGSTPQGFLDAVKSIPGINKVALVMGQQEVDL